MKVTVSVYAMHVALPSILPLSKTLGVQLFYQILLHILFFSLRYITKPDM